ncbi:MAG: hypothetical protein IT437_06675, partial [Phycisphaerales bacterium]|nr:hypothetical protein [Phycisphaerales bacterium]
PQGTTSPADLWDTWISRRTLNCGLDVDGDGLVTAMDFAAFTGLYAAGLPQADYKSDGVLNTQDVSAIQTDLTGP